jgi:hypothetical protein
MNSFEAPSIAQRRKQANSRACNDEPYEDEFSHFGLLGAGFKPFSLPFQQPVKPLQWANASFSRNPADVPNAAPGYLGSSSVIA